MSTNLYIERRRRSRPTEQNQALSSDRTANGVLRYPQAVPRTYRCWVAVHLDGRQCYSVLPIHEPRGTWYAVFPLSATVPLLCEPLPWQDISMTPSNPLQQLHGLDRASPQFHQHLGDFLRGNEYRNTVSNLQGEDLAWLVEYLDSVSL